MMKIPKLILHKAKEDFESLKNIHIEYLGVFKSKKAFLPMSMNDNGGGTGAPMLYLLNGNSIDTVYGSDKDVALFLDEHA